MKSSISHIRALALAVLALTVGSVAAQAQPGYPSQPIKIIVSLAPGGVADIMARAFAAKLGEQGKQVIVENRTGGGGIIGADAAAKSPPDGYTLYMGFHATQSILPHLQKLPYDPAKDFEPVVFITTSPNILIVHPSIPVNSPKELIAYIKANPGKLSYGSPGLGSSGHLAGEQFKQINNLEIQHVHYRGAAPALQDLVAGHVQVMFDIVPLTKEQLASGKVRALAVTAAKREAAVPNVPTFAELGMPGIEGGPWFGLFAPAGTPRAAIQWINAEANKAFSSPDLKSKFEGQGLTLPLGTPEAFGRHVTAETARWGEVIRKGNIKVQ